MQSVNPLDAGITRTLVLPVKRQILTHLIVTYTEHGKPVSLLNYRTVNRKVSLWGCGYGIAEKSECHPCNEGGYELSPVYELNGTTSLTTKVGRLLR
ncbi:hypothetical protein NXY07_10625 [Phocaeicola dorei]|nr:hypothetical protein [Phocaeicola dorei]